MINRYIFIKFKRLKKKKKLPGSMEDWESLPWSKKGT